MQFYKPINASLKYRYSAQLSMLFLTCVMFAAHAQTRQTQRFEQTQKNRDEYYTVVSLKDEGIALLREKDKYNNNKRIWELLLLDTALRERKTLEFEVEHRYPFIGYEHSPGQLYLLYRTGDNNRNDFHLINFNLIEGKEAERYDIKPELDFKVTHFSKAGASIVMGGYVSNEPAVFIYSLIDQNIKVIPGFFQKDSELVDLQVNENQTFNTVLTDRSLRAEKKVIFRTYDQRGKLLFEDTVPLADGHILQTSISSSLKREDLMVLGTWGDRKSKQSLGFFSLGIDPFRDQKVRFISFGELEHFTDYLKPKRAKRIKENARQDALEGRKPTYSNYVMPFKLEEHPAGFLLLAEIYDPSNTTNPYYTSPYYRYPYYGPGFPYYYNPFWPGLYPDMRMYRQYSHGNNGRNIDEVKMQASVLVAFDAQGNVLWDHSVTLDQLKKPSLEQVTDYWYNGSLVYFIYKKESDMVIKTINNIDGASNEITEKIKLNDPVEEIRSEKEHMGGVRHWFENAFYVWGYQTIRNVQKKHDRVRDVFYINKVVAE